MGTTRKLVATGVDVTETEDFDCIKGWLGKLDIDGLRTDLSDSDKKKTAFKSRLQPVTPNRRPHTVLGVHEEISPTDTSFSGHSIFDTPFRNKLKHRSPSIRLQIPNDDSDTSDSEGEWESTPIKERTLTPKAESVPEDPAAIESSHIPASSSADLNAYDPSVDLGVHGPHQPAEPTNQLLTYEPDTPRIVWLTSCLQCTLADLPCSRTHPSCSRCQRTGNPEFCLLHRRSFASEALDPSKSEKCRSPILLKVQGEDETSWKRKVELSKELRQKWLADQDKKNWVMPPIESPAGGWKKQRRFQTISGGDIHSGEGSGRVSYKELVVDLEA
ncbi:hypothetical protein PtrSN002B_007591 [Pyrenophora tritici-repentis]|uniref:GAL4 domain containing protein n=2 Tax=Pyrenophora tritici-repentis TaxID=45151 RepID=A0A2W1E755_9PLEO|nr:uncharacterized protein PTRG_01194 [Pyrenophora tritici-repentis Pt-1C-BFP]KAA8625830.1 hypothetical protein PtrV1_01510 [Pyrenophora tritici-repentis]EDU40632.1 predicted protein [Pyrenophora tritici-repentis Pt-1C-BFP]KAF7454248.1 hypothetical protein A1F99_015060 [Pyrenophora tritici-repentis]KAF7577346.1 GAL4 domain containing protein [Pyrenophora tritici-repentis]KAG9387994.1 hypothetical protein A1F94_000886 [Pyrenophora tritici-repentis]